VLPITTDKATANRVTARTSAPKATDMDKELGLCISLENSITELV